MAASTMLGFTSNTSSGFDVSAADGEWTATVTMSGTNRDDESYEEGDPRNFVTKKRPGYKSIDKRRAPTEETEPWLVKSKRAFRK